MESLFLSVYVLANGWCVIDAAHSVYIGAFHSTEYPVLETGLAVLHFADKLLRFLPVCVTVGRAGRFYNGELPSSCGTAYVLFGSEQQRSYHIEVLFGEVSHRRIAAYPSLGEEVHNEGLDRVVVIVTEGYLVAAERDRLIVQSTASEVRAETARVLLLADVKDDTADLREYDLVLDAVGLAELGDSGVVRGSPSELRIKRNSGDPEIYSNEAAELSQSCEEHNAVLSA